MEEIKPIEDIVEKKEEVINNRHYDVETIKKARYSQEEIEAFKLQRVEIESQINELSGKLTEIIAIIESQ